LPVYFHLTFSSSLTFDKFMAHQLSTDWEIVIREL
jgi:hypothetical protein